MIARPTWTLVSRTIGVAVVLLVMLIVAADYVRTGEFRSQPLELLLGIALALFGGWRLRRNGNGHGKP